MCEIAVFDQCSMLSELSNGLHAHGSYFEYKLIIFKALHYIIKPEVRMKSKMPLLLYMQWPVCIKYMCIIWNADVEV